ncbi:hypothetical protein OIU74_013701 [Salix koriyanagi]|uniref:Uncharacterized protein n=1 Tax=Salix koriyanagi TaxID=2511006 RepID=A0A9Q0Q9Q9_9ROSI|nr:hypothetical protein OIU74_013701 [Salix koriyanagi]
MRIRNSQTSFPIPLVPQAVLRSTHFRSQFQHFDERFVVEEENRRIGWPYYPVRKHSSSDVQKVRPHDGLHSAIASEIKSSDFVEKKTGKENSMPAMQSHVINIPFLPAISPFMDLGSQKLEEPDKEGRTSNSSAASRRNVKGPRFSASVVLALSAPCAQPARGKKVYRKQKELPLKKRKKSRKLEIERTQAEKEEAATVKQDRTKEAFNKDDTSQKISWWRQLLCQTERGEGQGRIQCISQWQLLALLPSRHGPKLMQRSARPHMKQSLFN